MNTPTPADLSGLTARGLVKIVITTYGILHGPQPEGDAYEIDLTRALRNPPEDSQVRERMVHMTGTDKEVREYVLGTPGARAVVERNVRRVKALVEVSGRELTHLRVRCMGGKHRSVAIAEEIALWLRADGIQTEVEHRDKDKPVVQSSPTK